MFPMETYAYLFRPSISGADPAFDLLELRLLGSAVTQLEVSRYTGSV